MSTLSSNNKSPLYDCICRIETMSYKIFLKTWSLTMNEIISFPMFFSVSGSHKNNSKRYTLMPCMVVVCYIYLIYTPRCRVIKPKLNVPFLQYFPHKNIFPFFLYFPFKQIFEHETEWHSMSTNFLLYLMSPSVNNLNCWRGYGESYR